jgi:DNA-binding response OmpR family regulator
LKLGNVFASCSKKRVRRPIEVDGNMSKGTTPRPRVLVVEDNPLLARFTRLLLTQFGCEVVGPVARVEDAVALADTAALDAALLDVNVADRSAVPIGEILERRGIPYAVMTGYGRENMPTAFHDKPCLYKPFRESDLKAAITALIGTIPPPAAS